MAKEQAVKAVAVTRLKRGLARSGYNVMMTDSADHLAVAIRQIVKETIEATLRSQVQPKLSPPEPPRSTDQSTDRLLYSVKEIQSKLSIGRSTVYHLLDDGQLPSVRIGRRRFVTAAAVAEYVRGLA